MQLHITHKTVKFMPTSPVSHVVIYSQLSACPLRGDGIIMIQGSPEHSRTSRHDSEQATAKAAYIYRQLSVLSDTCLKM